MGCHEGVTWRGSDVDALIRLYKKHGEIWDRTYGSRVRNILKTVWDEQGGGKILALGAGTPVRFPRELDGKLTVVERSEKILKLWEEEKRRARFVTADLAKDIDKIKDLTKEHDLIVLPAILSWLPESTRKRVGQLAREAMGRGKTILAYDTTHASIGYEGEERRASQIMRDNWHDEYIGGPRIVLPVGIWVMAPRPVLSGAHLVDPGEEYFVEASVHTKDRKLLESLRERLKPLAKEGYMEAEMHSKDLREYVQRKHSRWVL